VVSRPRPRDICTSIAHISLRGVRRTTSPRQVSTDERGNIISRARLNRVVFEANPLTLK